MQVDWLSELGSGEDTDSFEVHLVFEDGEKKRIRVMNIAHFKELRRVHNVPDTVTDMEFLLEDDQFKRMLKAIHCDHVELSLSKMSPKKDGNRRVEFPANAFDGGEIKSTSHK